VKKKRADAFLMPLMPTLRSGRIETMGHLIGDGNGVRSLGRKKGIEM
jgi:hypothetical protein